MRVTTDFWVSALVRRVFGGGGFAAVVKRGSSEAGAVFVIVRNRLGGAQLFGPAPQTSYDTAKPDERFFTRYELEDEAALDARLEKERRFDPDIWVVEIEPGQAASRSLIYRRRRLDRSSAGHSNLGGRIGICRQRTGRYFLSFARTPTSSRRCAHDASSRSIAA